MLSSFHRFLGRHRQFVLPVIDSLCSVNALLLMLGSRATTLAYDEKLGRIETSDLRGSDSISRSLDLLDLCEASNVSPKCGNLEKTFGFYCRKRAHLDFFNNKHADTIRIERRRTISKINFIKANT